MRAYDVGLPTKQKKKSQQKAKQGCDSVSKATK
jgi:hypothetical protein